jgi:hypothetical protein
MDGSPRNAPLLTRRRALALGARTVLAGSMAGPLSSLTPARAQAASGTENDVFLAFMDTVSARLADQWSDTRGAYHPTVGGYSTLVNARMLQVHANAAAVGHTGPSRNDARALSLVSVLLASPSPWRTVGDAYTRQDKMFHIPGWTESLNEPDAAMDKAVDPQVAEALTAAWRAAEVLGMDEQTRQTLVEHVSTCARGPFFRYPGIRLNQLNWNCALYSLDAELTGATDLLREDYREQMMRFVDYATRAKEFEGTPNFGPGWHFSYLPNWPPSAAFNFDAAEYSNETIDSVRHYSQALAAGMEPLPGSALEVLRAWAWRALYGYWTHAGYLNWDTGLGSKRRYIGKVFALAQQGLLAIASTPIVHRTSSMSAHARWLFERGLDLYEQWSEEDPSGLAPPVQFGDRAHPQSEESRILFAARMASNAAQAIHLGLGTIGFAEPPSMYSFDPDTQRLAISTPSYSTAIVVHNHDAVPYGGLDLCRLFNSRQQPVGSIAGEGIANFMARVRSHGGEVVLDTQMGANASMSILARSTDGSQRSVGPGAEPYPELPYAGPMRSVSVTGKAVRGDVWIETRHELTARAIYLRWIMALPPKGEWEVALPSYGADAQILLEHDSARNPLTPGVKSPTLGKIERILVQSAQGAYSLQPLGERPRGTLSLGHVPPGSGASVPGPSLLIAGHATANGTPIELSLRLLVV